MLANQLTEFLSDTLGIKPGTVAERIKALRAAGLVAKGIQGPGRGARMGEADAVNALLACLIDHERGADVAAAIARARSHPGDVFVLPPANFLRDATFTAALTAGEALDALFADLRHKRLNHDLRMSVVVEASGAWIGVSASLPTDHMGHGNAVGHYITDERNKSVERQTAIHSDVLVSLAEALGPPD